MSQNTDLALAEPVTKPSDAANVSSAPTTPKPDAVLQPSFPLLLTDRQTATDTTAGARVHEGDQRAATENAENRPVLDMLPPISAPIADYWSQPAVVAPNNFINKSLSTFAFNVTVGCAHGCLYCYVPSVSAIKQGPALLAKGVQDPDAEWGNYVMVRPLDEKALVTSVRKADATPLAELKADGNRAVMFCTTTDPYQRIRHLDKKKAGELTKALRRLVRRGMEVIRDESTLRVRILTRGTEAVIDFELMKTLGDRLLFGMSLPTLDDALARIYEPNAPSPSARLKVLQAARAQGLNVYVAMAPTYPECDEADLRATLQAIKELDPVTVFHEPINIRADNVERIRAHAEAIGKTVNTEVFATDEAWQKYALEQLKLVERIAEEVGLGSRLHLWPDKALGSKAALARVDDPEAHQQWLDKWWGRISEWPGKTASPTNREKGDAGKVGTKKVVLNKHGLSIRQPDEILAMEFDPDDDWLENGVVAKGQFSTMCGPGGASKSWLALQLAACTILGRPFLGMPVRSKKIKWLVLQAENSSRRLKADMARLRAWVGEGDWPTVNANLVVHTLENPRDTALSLSDPATVEKIAGLLKKVQPDSVIFDPLYAFATGSLNTDAGMLASCQAITDVVKQHGKPDTSILVLHHALTGKAGAARATGYDRSSYGRGSKALQFFTRGQINVAPASADSNDPLVISCGKNSNGAEFAPFGICRNEDTMVYEVDPDFDLEAWQEETGGAGTTRRAKFSADDVADLVEGKSMKPTALLEAVMGAVGCKKSTAYNLITKAKGHTIKLNDAGEYVPA